MMRDVELGVYVVASFVQFKCDVFPLHYDFARHAHLELC